MKKIKAVDLTGQYLRSQQEIDQAINRVLTEADFIQGRDVTEFERELGSYVDADYVVTCGNGTDALQIAMMGLGFKPGDEIILPVHTYVATAEVVALLGLTPVFVDVDEDTFTLNLDEVRKKITAKTVAIVPVHLYGQCAHMEPLLQLAQDHGVHIIEDNAQALGAVYTFSDGRKVYAGTLGTVGTTSFFPSKNLGAFGDGGALFCKDERLAQTLRMIANHGQRVKYHHDIVGVNSRLDTIQAVILRIKLKHLEEYITKRRAVANFYDLQLKGLGYLKLPSCAAYSSHVYHQYTLTTVGIDRDRFRQYLLEKGIPSMIYYPVPLHHQRAYNRNESYPVAERLSSSVISLPIHTELDEEQLSYICEAIRSFN